MPKYDKPPAHRLVQRRDGSFNVLARNDRGAARANSIAVVATPVTSSGPNPPPPSRPNPEPRRVMRGNKHQEHKP